MYILYRVCVEIIIIHDVFTTSIHIPHVFKINSLVFSHRSVLFCTTKMMGP